jgi:hypothetical protein
MGMAPENDLGSIVRQFLPGLIKKKGVSTHAEGAFGAGHLPYPTNGWFGHGMHTMWQHPLCDAQLP